MASDAVDASTGPDANSLLASYDAALSALRQEVQTQPPLGDYSFSMPEIDTRPPFPAIGTLAYQNSDNVFVGKLNTLDAANISHGSFYENAQYAVVNGALGVTSAANGTIITVAQPTGFRPFADVTYSLGTTTQRWSDAYLYQIHFGNNTASVFQNAGYAVIDDIYGTALGVNGTPVLITENVGPRPFADNTYSLGTSGHRWTVVYATTGTINTSDGNQKQQVRSLSEAESRVAKAIKGKICSYKLNSAVEQKGDGARTHIGVIAQDVKATFAAEGLDASKYGLFCEDENGFGVRYDELLTFIVGSL